MAAHLQITCQDGNIVAYFSGCPSVAICIMAAKTVAQLHLPLAVAAAVAVAIAAAQKIKRK